MASPRISGILATAALCVSVAAGTQQSPSSREQAIRAQVEQRLVSEGIRGISVAVREGTVTLTGTVPSVWTKDDAIEQAQRVEGVVRVVSTLTIARAENDNVLAQAVAEKVRQYAFFSIYDDVNVAVNDGIVTLTGYVTMPYKSGAMAELASRVTGVQGVSNKIEGLPVSTLDDVLRYRIATRIYGGPLFSNYAIQVNPPIHIVVRYGHVTLTGVVLSEVERMKAEVIVRSVSGVFTVENKLRLEPDDP